jgi:hypothetical protein
MDPRKQYEGKLEDYPLTSYPDYEPGHPRRSERLEKIGFVDEVEKIWGSRWGGVLESDAAINCVDQTH